MWTSVSYSLCVLVRHLVSEARSGMYGRPHFHTPIIITLNLLSAPEARGVNSPRI